MIYALATDDRMLHVFAEESEAIAMAEGIDVGAGHWLFFDASGCPLDARFTKPNEQGWISVLSGRYHLVPATTAGSRHLLELLSHVSQVVGRLSSLGEVRQQLAKYASGS